MKWLKSDFYIPQEYASCPHLADDFTPPDEGLNLGLDSDSGQQLHEALGSFMNRGGNSAAAAASSGSGGGSPNSNNSYVAPPNYGHFPTSYYPGGGGPYPGAADFGTKYGTPPSFPTSSPGPTVGPPAATGFQQYFNQPSPNEDAPYFSSAAAASGGPGAPPAPAGGSPGSGRCDLSYYGYNNGFGSGGGDGGGPGAFYQQQGQDNNNKVSGDNSQLG